MATETTQPGQTGQLRKPDTPFVSEVFGHVSGTVGGVATGVKEMYQDWRTHTNDSDTILKYGAFGLAMVGSIGVASTLLGGLGGDNVFGRMLRLGLTTAFSTVVAGTAAEMVNGKSFGAALGDSVTGTMGISKQLYSMIPPEYMKYAAYGLGAIALVGGTTWALSSRSEAKSKHEPPGMGTPSGPGGPS